MRLCQEILQQVLRRINQLRRKKCCYLFLVGCSLSLVLFTVYLLDERELKLVKFLKKQLYIHTGSTSKEWVSRNNCKHLYSTLDGEFLVFHRKVLHEPIYIFSAFHTHRYKEEQVVLSGASHKDINLDCCFIAKNGSFYRENVSQDMEKPAWGGGSFDHFLPVQYLCPYNRKMQPVAVTLTAMYRACHLCRGDYIEVLDPPKNEGKFAICVPFLYGDIPIEHIIEWMEYYKLLGVHKVFVYYLHAQQNIMNLLAQFQEEGFVEIVMADFPGVVKGYNNRDTHFIKRIWPQYDSDLQFCVTDCIERTSEFSYAAIYDLDEYIVPAVFNITNLLQVLTKEYPNAAGFYTQNMILPQEWKPSHPDSTLERRKYRKVMPDWTRDPKSIHIPKRLEKRNVHKMWGREKYSVVKIPEKVATLYHFRMCKDDRVCAENKSMVDHQLDIIEKDWSSNVEARKKRLGL